MHHFCEECLLLWTAAKGTNKFCPICRYVAFYLSTLPILKYHARAPIEKEAIQRIHFGKYATPERALDQHGLQSRLTRGLAKYNVLPEETRLVRC